MKNPKGAGRKARFKVKATKKTYLIPDVLIDKFGEFYNEETEMYLNLK